MEYSLPYVASLLILGLFILKVSQVSGQINSGFAGDTTNVDSYIDSLKSNSTLASDSLLNTLLASLPGIKDIMKDSVTTEILISEIPITSQTNQWDDFSKKAELWKKCGIASDGLVPNLPASVGDFTISSNGSASLQTQYFNSGNSLPHSFTPDGWYSILSATNSLYVASIPVSLSGNVVFQNNAINFDYSTGNFSFDHRKLLQSFKERLVSTKVLEKLQGVDLLPEKILDSLSQFEDALAWINDPENLNAYIKSYRITDSIESLMKSTAITYADSMLLDSVRQVKSKYEEAKQFYQKLFKLYQKYQGSIENIQAQLTEVRNVKQGLESITNPDVLIEMLNKDSLLSKKERMLSSVRQFQIGSGTISISPLTLNDFLFKGAQTEIYSKGMYLSAGGGVMQSFPFLVPGALLPENFLSRTVGYITAGEGTIDSSYTHGSLVYLHDHPTASGSAVGYTVSKTDWIGSVRKKMLLGDQYSVYTEWAYSSLNFKGQNSGEPTISSPVVTKADILDKSAAEIAFRRDNESEHATLLVRYTGPSYMTLGNPMSLSNIIHTELEYGTSVFENRLEATIAGYYDQPVNSEITGYKAQHWGIRTKALYHLPASIGFVSISWMPDQLETVAHQYNDVSSIYQHLSINGFFNYKVLGIRQSTFADLSAFFASSRFGETSSTSKFITGSLMQEIYFSRHHLSLQCFITDNHAAYFASRQLISQLTDCIQLKKNSAIVGATWTDMTVSPPLAGLVLGGNITAGKAGIVTVSANLKVAVEGVLSFRNSQQMLSVVWQVNW